MSDREPETVEEWKAGLPPNYEDIWRAHRVSCGCPVCFPPPSVKRRT